MTSYHSRHGRNDNSRNRGTSKISERDGFLELYDEVTQDFTVRANLVPDAHLATLLRQHGVATLFTNHVDDFARFEFLDVRNPLDSK